VLDKRLITLNIF